MYRNLDVKVTIIRAGGVMTDPGGVIPAELCAFIPKDTTMIMILADGKEFFCKED